MDIGLLHGVLGQFVNKLRNFINAKWDALILLEACLYVCGQSVFKRRNDEQHLCIQRLPDIVFRC